MDMDKSVKHLLATAEASLAKLSGDFAASRDYDRAGLALSIAQEIGGLAAKWSRATESRPTADDAERPAASTDPDQDGSASSVQRKKGKKSSYPKFYRQADYLVKIGYSKSEGEYEHKSPRSVLLRLVEALQRAGAKGARFSMNDILPLTAADGNEVPSYQPYLCLNWLRETRLVRQHGRRGYSIPKSADWVASVQAQWEQLPKS